MKGMVGLRYQHLKTSYKNSQKYYGYGVGKFIYSIKIQKKVCCYL